MSNANEIQLPSGKTASILLFEAIDAAVQTFPSEFAEVDMPANSKVFKNRYVSFLPEFEAARRASTQHLEIAQCLVDFMQESIVWQSESGSCALSEHLKGEAQALPLRKIVGGKAQIAKPTFFYEGQHWDNFARLGERLYQKNVLTKPAHDALAWIEENFTNLQGRKIVVMGAAAEMASTELFLKLGAEVLWLDQAAPPESWMQNNEFSGTLHFPESNSDLLTQPREILATIQAFSNGDAVDLCLYAYAPGRAREIRLTAAMNALVDALPSSTVASITILVSPTTAAALNDEEVQKIASRFARRPKWEAALDVMGVFGRSGGVASVSEKSSARSLVSIQGTSYQAAQYLGKLMTSVIWAEQGHRVSANTAAITKTRSLDHPVFDAAFGGAAALGVETFSAEQSKCLSGLLAIHDWLKVQAPVPGTVRIHGGIHALPYPLELALRPAAAIGFLKRPQLLLRFFR